MNKNEEPGGWLGEEGKANTQRHFQAGFHPGQFIAQSHGTDP